MTATEQTEDYKAHRIFLMKQADLAEAELRGFEDGWHYDHPIGAYQSELFTSRYMRGFTDAQAKRLQVSA